MGEEPENDSRQFRVVRNDEDQHSIWFADRELPLGWVCEGTTGTKAECLSRIAEVWTDMRPRSLRRRMDGETVGVKADA